MRDQKRAGQVGFEDVFPDGKWKLFDRKIGMRDAGVVDENVEALELLAGGTEEGVDGVGIADIAGMGEDLILAEASSLLAWVKAGCRGQ